MDSFIESTLISIHLLVIISPLLPPELSLVVTAHAVISETAPVPALLFQIKKVVSLETVPASTVPISQEVT
ncbi:hypothetical protein D3C85_1815670 [compost metagenome]